MQLTHKIVEIRIMLLLYTVQVLDSILNNLSVGCYEIILLYQSSVVNLNILHGNYCRRSHQCLSIANLLHFIGAIYCCLEGKLVSISHFKNMIYCDLIYIA